MKELITLNQAFVDSLTLPVGKTDMFRFDSDEALRGFAIRIRIDRRGRTVKKWVVCYKNEDGSQRRRNIGSAARMSATAARLKARSWLAKVADGNDPAGTNDKAKKVNAFRFEKAVETYLAIKQAKVSPSSYKHSVLYPTGSIVPDEALGTNRDRIISNRSVVMRPAPQSAPQPRDLPKPQKAEPRPQVQIIDDRSPLESWILTRDALVRVVGNRQLAMDILMADRDARSLFLRAQSEGCAAEARRQGKPSVPPNAVPGLIG
jgi:hypothetical protein